MVFANVLDYHDTGPEVFADRYNVPDYKWVYNVYANYTKNKFGSSDGADVFLKLREVIEEYNNERGYELAKVKQTATGETIIAICDEFNHRVHDLLIMEATANIDRIDSKLFHLMCPTPIVGLPLGTLILTRADETTIGEALNLYKSLLTDKSFSEEVI